MVDYLIASTNQHYKMVAEFFKEYADGLNINLGFQHFDEELQILKEMYTANCGGIILRKHETEYIGCVASGK